MNSQTEQEIVEHIYRQWQQHFAPLNPIGLAALYAEDAILFGSRIPPYIGRAAIESYFLGLPQGLYTGVAFFPEYINRPISDVISIAGSATFQRADLIPLELRITHVLVRRESEWQIVSHHVSPKQNL
jgi:ketosteroid isomerase-like protein